MLKQRSRLTVVLTVVLLALCVGAGSFLRPSLLPPEVPTGFAAPIPGVGLWVEQGSILSDETSSPKEMRAQVDALFTFAGENGIAEIYWDTGIAKTDNALSRLCRAARQAGMAVYAVLPAADADQVKQLERKAELAGYLLACDAAEAEQGLAAMAAMTEKPLGLLARQGGGYTAELLAKLANSGSLQRFLPVMSDGLEQYAKEAALWSSLPVAVRPLPAAGADRQEVGLQLFYGGLQGLEGYAIPYRMIAEDADARSLLLGFGEAAVEDTAAAVDLAIAPKLGVGYPTDGLTVTGEKLYVMGSCDPTQPLLLNGKPVERVAAGGCYGAEVRLAVGSNRLTLRQGDETVQVTVYRSSGGGGGYTSTVSSRYPVADAPAWPGEAVSLYCVAPAGGKVTATVNGTTVAMKQVAAAAKGVAAGYRGSYTVPKTLPAGQMNDLGTVAYTLSYGGKSQTLRSAGRLLAAGEGVTPMVLATTENVSLLEKYSDDSSILATYHRGARIAATGCLQYGSTLFYQVAGGYIADHRATLAEEAYPAATTVTDITSETAGRDTTFTFACGNAPAVSGRIEDGKLYLLLENTTLPGDLSGIQCEWLAAVEQRPAEGGTELILTPADPAMLWGYDYQYNEAGDLLVTLKKAPVKSTLPGKPLAGITVMVDPGHGNYDCGALGAAGYWNGPCEAELNLAVALMLQQRLEQLGATVQMVRTTDDPNEAKIELDERVQMAVTAKPDFFLSVHHNSTALTKEVTADWMEAYYYEEASRPFALALQQHTAQRTGRPVSEAEWGYYYVTRLCICPAVLYEVGYLPNPEQYEDCADRLTICRTAYGLAEAIVASVPEAAPAPVE